MLGEIEGEDCLLGLLLRNLEDCLLDGFYSNVERLIVGTLARTLVMTLARTLTTMFLPIHVSLDAVTCGYGIMYIHAIFFQWTF